MTTIINSVNQNMNRNYLLVVLSVMFFCFGFYAGESETDFSGTWKFKEAESELSEGRFRGAPSQLIVSQNENELLIERLYVRSSGEEFRSTEKLSLDGKECVNPAFGDNEKKSTATWSDEKKILTISSVIEFEREGELFTIQISEIWSLSDDGKNLIIDYTSVSSRGERKNKFIYDIVQS